MKRSQRLFLLASATLVGCHPSGKEVAGIYSAPYSQATDYVVLRADHSYTHYATLRGRKQQQAGSWHFSTQAGQEKLIMKGWIFYADPFADMDKGRLGIPTTCSIYWTPQKLLFQPDFDAYNYFRQ